MNRALPILSLCLALFALAIALMPRDPVVVPPPPADAPRASADETELRRRVELLEDDNRSLWDRVVLLERRQVTVINDAGVMTPALVTEVAQLRAEVRSVMTGEVLSNEAGRAALKEVIREAEADRQRERQVAQQQRQQERAIAQKVKWKAFATTARLTWAQEQELNKRLDAEEAHRQALQAQLQAGAAPQDAFRALRDERRENDKAIKAQLDETQQQQYDELRREDRGGGGGGRANRQAPSGQ